MYSVVLMAALTTGIDMPDRGGRGCHGCRGGCWGGCYGGWGGGWGGCWGGGGWGGCYGGMGMGWGGCYGGYGMGYGGGYGGYALGGFAPVIRSGYAYSPIISSVGTPIVSAGGMGLNQGTTQSFYSNPVNSGNQATLIVNVPQSASLSIDGQPTQQSSNRRIFTSPPLEQGKTYVYKVSAEINRDGHVVRDSKTVEVQAGQRSEVTMNFGNSNRGSEERSEPADNNAPTRNNAPRSSPRQPPIER